MTVDIENILRHSGVMGTTVEDLDLGAVPEGEMAQYGVLGQKWGVRKDEGPKKPKVVSAKTQAKREKRAQRYVTRAKAYQDRINILDKKRKTQNSFQKYFTDNERRGLVSDMKTALADAERKRQGKLSQGQKRVVIGASVVAALIAAKVTADTIQSGQGRRLIERGKELVTGKKFSFKRNTDLASQGLSADQIKELVTSKINPDFGEIGTTMNCRRATMAYELRRRGYDVMATRTTNAYGQNMPGLLNALSPGQKEAPTSVPGWIGQVLVDTYNENRNGTPSELKARAKKFMELGAGAANKIHMDESWTGPKAIMETLSTQPNGSRGELGLQWLMGGGHSVAYEIINNKPVIFDNQTGKVFDTAEQLVENLPQIINAGFTRLDDIPLNMDFLMKWVRNVG